ncbi:SH3 domain-containing protein [Kroppenstedtia eburnea]|uniref:SH3 domain-containing protein n=1 Tax=Kroppenstedtia eburnea TaxID=714067 RepID=A0A1N7N6R6_9BACL|nr:SH3 domain-containing protein [Kroppenstedtia eburnea]
MTKTNPPPSWRGRRTKINKLTSWGTWGLSILLTAALFLGAAVPTANAATSTRPWIEVNKATNRLTLHQAGRAIKSYSVATGRSQSLTPEGTFKVVVKFIKPGWKGIAGGLPENPLGERWIGIQVNGDRGRTYGIHGTNQPDSIGTHASSGCVRMRNRDVIDLYNRVPEGTLVKIHDGRQNPAVKTASGQVTITATRANLRSQPSLTATVVEQSGKGNRLTLTGTVGEWYRVKRTHGKTAYVHQSVSRKGGSSLHPPKGKVTVTARLANIRKTPSMSGKVLQRVVRGKQLKATGKKGNWIQIRLSSGQTAFIHQNILR